MATPGQQFASPTGDTLRFVQTTAQTGGALLEVEVAYVPGHAAPPAHLHPAQTEHFEVLAGVAEVLMGTQVHLYRAGDHFEVPAGGIHTMRNAGDDLLRLCWKVRPALRTEALFEAFWGLAQAGETDAQGKPNLLQSAVILHEYAPEFRLARPAYPVQRVLLGLLAPLGRLAGYRTHYAG